MSPIAESLLQESLKLPEIDRAKIAAQLLGSIYSEPEDDIPELPESEIARRIQELDDGTVKAIPWSEARNLILMDDEAHR